MWLANALTVSRIPLGVGVWLTYGDPAWSIGLVLAAALTDAADGAVARRALRRTGDTGPTAGEWLDPLADKAFVILVLGAIQAHDPAPWGLVALIAARELVLIPLAAAYRLVVPGRAPHSFKAGTLGKAATVAELGAITALILRQPIAVPLAVAAAGLGLAAVVKYVARSLAARAVPSSPGAS